MKRCAPRFISFRLLAAVSVLAVPSAAAFAVTSEALLQKPASVEQALQITLGTSKVAKNNLKYSNALQAFYAERNYEPYWLRRSAPSGDAEDLLEIIEESWTHGLNPKSYHLENIKVLWNQKDKQNLSDLDLLLSDAYLRLAQDLTGIRVDPSPLKSSKRFWRQPIEAQVLLGMLAKSGDVERLLKSLEPQGKTYGRLRQELQDLVRDAPPAYESVLPIRMSGSLRPYESSKVVPVLRYRLGLPENTVEPYVYDDSLAAAVIKFQRENSLKDDGIVGGQTLNILNISKEQKIHQVIANLERLRWVDENKPDKFVVVNIPSATLWAVDNGKVEFEMPVIVGRQKRPTNMFITEIEGVRFNPNWTVPPTIKKDDILPKLRENPDYLSEKGMELIGMTEEGQMTLDPTVIDWSTITEADLKYLRFVQDAGDNNPLGRVRVLMPNRYNIYLHDTNEKNYFDKAGRAVSSGCVRMKDPERMAAFIMRNRSTWEDGDMEAMFAQGKTRDISIDTPIPVYMLYYTVWINQNGDLVYGNDLYGHDENLIKMLSELDGIFIPVNNTEMSKVDF